MVRAYLYDSEGTDQEAPLTSETVAGIGDTQLLWVDVNGYEEVEIASLASLFALPPPLIEALGDAGRRPRLDSYPQCFHLNVHSVQERSSGLKRVAIEFIVLRNALISLHGESVNFLDSFDRRVKGDSHLGRLNGPALLTALLDWHITGFFRIIEGLEGETDRVEDSALRLRDDRNLLGEMVKLRRRVASVRRSLVPHREVYAGLARPDFCPFVSAETIAFCELLYQRLERAIEATENARELVLGSFDIFTTQTTLRTNEVVKILTLISAVLLPAGVVTNMSVLFIRAPVYNMGRIGLWAMLSAMCGATIAAVALARKRRWL